MRATSTDVPARPAKKKGWRHELRQLFVLILVVLGIHSFVGKPFYIPSESMMPTLLVGDRLIVSKFPYGYSYSSLSLPILPPIRGRLFGRLPERGDIVVVKAPGTRLDFIKRVIGLPGDRVRVTEGQLYLNGRPVPREEVVPLMLPQGGGCSAAEVVANPRGGGEPLCPAEAYREQLPNGRTFLTLDLVPGSLLDEFPETEVPAGHLFLMGDNRDNSADSRVPPPVGLGMLPVENLEGRAEFITFSFDSTARLLAPTTWRYAFRPDRAGKSLSAPVQP